MNHMISQSLLSITITTGLITINHMINHYYHCYHHLVVGLLRFITLLITMEKKRSITINHDSSPLMTDYD